MWLSNLLTRNLSCVFVLLLFYEASTVISTKQPDSCQQYQKVDFFSASEQAKRIPSLLYTFPGSGNTWLELLISHATGIHTGSVYPDKRLIQSILPGYFHCDRSVSLVLMHTVHHFGKDIEKGKISNLCLESNITRFHKVVMLYRNPFDAIWSDFQRQATEHNNNHTGIIPISRFLTIQPIWQRFSLSMSNQYASMIENHYPAVERMYGDGNYMYIRYEDMLQKDLREGILAKLVSFLDLTSSPERIKCAFSLSDTSGVRM